MILINYDQQYMNHSIILMYGIDSFFLKKIDKNENKPLKLMNIKKIKYFFILCFHIVILNCFNKI